MDEYFKQQDEFLAEMISAYENNLIGKEYEPYFAWKKGSPLFNREQWIAMRRKIIEQRFLLKTQKNTNANLKLYLDIINAVLLETVVDVFVDKNNDNDISLIKSKINKQYDVITFFGYYKGKKIYSCQRVCTVGLKCGLPNFAYIDDGKVILVKNIDEIYNVIDWQ